MFSFLKIIKLETVESTNNYARKLAEKGEKEITVIRAECQAKGRGRRSNKWSSPQGGIYASFILKPLNPLREIAILPMLFALGVCKTLKGIVNAKIKRPNDVYVQNKKISGILVETCGNEKGVDFVIAGVGININTKSHEIPAFTTSLYLETSNNYSIEDLFKKLISNEINLYSEFKKGNMDKLIDQIGYFCDKDKNWIKN